MREFHEPFLKNLVIICLVTIVSMVSAHFFIHKGLSPYLKTHSFSSHESQEKSNP